jgi:hypothetical protein
MGEAAMQIARPGLAGIDHGFELGGRQQPRGDGALGQIGHILRPGCGDRRHGGGFDEVGWMLARFGQNHSRGAGNRHRPRAARPWRGLIEHLVGNGPHLVGLRRRIDDGPRRTAFHRPEEAQLAGAGD